MFIYKAANSTTFFLRKRGVNAKNIGWNYPKIIATGRGLMCEDGKVNSAGSSSKCDLNEAFWDD